jgi:gamma-glutamylcyclotransferase (GGCT)/AIG2-like uncharacterized protein YtfP
MKPTTYRLFVYGSLRSGFHHPAYEYISRYFHLIAPATVKGSLFDMGEYPAALPEPATHTIVGELYEIKNPDEFSWAMAQLDDYEGLNPENGEPALFRRDTVHVFTDKGESTAWMYWYNGDTTGKPVIASGDVLAWRAQQNK